MKNSLWIVNSLLALLCISMVATALLIRVKVPLRKQVEPAADSIALPKKEISKVDPARIYNNDLFGTYIPPLPPTAPTINIPAIPAPPSLKIAPPPPPPAPQFLDPLKITLKGILAFEDDQKNKVIIADEAEKQTLYGIGDKVSDAYIVHIFENKILLIRSNGQQETIYLREIDAQNDRELSRIKNITTLVQQVNDTNFVVDPATFSAHVSSLGQLVDVLDLSSVFKKGKGFGCRIGTLTQDSLGTALGFKRGDIIRSVNGILATDTQARLAIYSMLTNLTIGALVEVTLVREGTPRIHHYTLQTLSLPEKNLSDPLAAALEQELITDTILHEEQQLKILDRKRTFEPASTTYKKAEKRALFKKAKHKPLLKNII